MELLNNFWQLFLLSAPWLMLGLLLAGLINVFIPKDFLQKHLGKEGFWTTVKAALIGAPMPLCSCGVIPAAVGLRRAGSSKSATTAFLVSTPETGVDSISVSYVLLGPFMAVIRPIAAVSSAIVAGVLVGREDKHEHVRATETNSDSTSSCCSAAASVAESQPKVSCCASKEEVAQQTTSSCCESDSKKEQTIASDSCCERETTSSACCDSDNPSEQVSLASKLWQATKYSSNKLLSDTMTWLMIGLFFAALVQTYVPESFLSQWGSGVLAMLVVILVSIPMYICATASTPIAAGLLMAGVSPGAVLVFMLAGPATNIATLGVVAKELGRRAVIAYLSGVIGVAIVFGFLTDFLVSKFGFAVEPMTQMHHEVLPTWLSMSAGLLLLALMARLVIISIMGKINSNKVLSSCKGGQT